MSKITAANIMAGLNSISAGGRRGIKMLHEKLLFIHSLMCIVITKCCFKFLRFVSVD